MEGHKRLSRLFSGNLPAMFLIVFETALKAKFSPDREQNFLGEHSFDFTSDFFTLDFLFL